MSTRVIQIPVLQSLVVTSEPNLRRFLVAIENDRLAGHAHPEADPATTDAWAGALTAQITRELATRGAPDCRRSPTEPGAPCLIRAAARAADAAGCCLSCGIHWDDEALYD